MPKKTDDDLEVPDFLKVKNRKPLTPEQEARVAEFLATARPPAPVGRFRRPEDQAEFDRLQEEKRQQKITAMKNRIARSKDKVPEVPAGATWDTRTSRWVMPGESPKTVSQLAAQAGPTTRQIMDTIKSTRKDRAMANNGNHGNSNHVKPDFAAMTGAQLLAEYNKLSTTQRKAKFSDKPQAIKAVESAWVHKYGKPEAPGEAVAKIAKAAKELVKVAKAPSEGARQKKLLMRIKRVTKKNPRREKTDAYRHYEEMTDGRTVGEYLAAFKPEERRTAAQWLSNTIRDGHVQVV